jgi:hypothetical protein
LLRSPWLPQFGKQLPAPGRILRDFKRAESSRSA